MPIIGSGDIASVLIDREDFTYFASGVSNSQEARESEYRREIELLKKQNKEKRLVYFGSLSIFYSKNRYAQHKRFMEDLVRTYFSKHTIVRLGNITWGTNPHTIINFFKEKKRKGEPIEIRNEQRYIIDKDEFLHWINLIPNFNCELNVTGKRMTIKEIVEQLC